MPKLPGRTSGDRPSLNPRVQVDHN